ncbi:hypothetical protein CXG81DRAFT_24676 [Caulochytrium protostelioides]|uniref:Outer dynein arm-docking complex subunit 4 n=1 Tax=Caulochytrium protostelioides TaxID=1555241 RepID=A0A4P9XC51_9FUNG|nr:hypothetical protein CXG81DRAFT_24676 [Caulochytrium protostelioides]|eukprot:RKP02711.1 hypothetical protein CXG81DRAFT_24676 [Caulochytrium protostelioides]
MADAEMDGAAAAPPSLVQILSHADHLFRTGHYESAIQAFDQALAQPMPTPQAEAALLCTRARCYGQLGDATRALADAERALALHPNTTRTVGTLADLLYAAGDYERALMWYSRGTRIPGSTAAQFHEGMLKCQQIILDTTRRLDKKGVRAVVAAQHAAHADADADADAVDADAIGSGPAGAPRGRALAAGGVRSHGSRRPSRSAVAGREHYLDELADDLRYMQELARDQSLMAVGQTPWDGRDGDHDHDHDADGSASLRDRPLHTVISAGLAYLEGRVEYWHARSLGSHPHPQAASHGSSGHRTRATVHA